MTRVSSVSILTFWDFSVSLTFWELAAKGKNQTAVPVAALQELAEREHLSALRNSQQRQLQIHAVVRGGGQHSISAVSAGIFWGFESLPTFQAVLPRNFCIPQLRRLCNAQVFVPGKGLCRAVDTS